MPDDIHPASDGDRRPSVLVTVSADALTARLAELPTRKEMHRAVLLGITTGAGLVQCLAWIFR